MTLLLKTLSTLVIGHGGIMLMLTRRKLRPGWLAFIVLGGVMQTTQTS